MTENEMRLKIVNKAKSYLGTVEGSAKHKEILGIYNGHKPLARGYKLQPTDAWCAGFASAMAIACGLTDIIPTEVSCTAQIRLFQQRGRWVENDAYTPAPGDYIYYVWSDNGRGDNTSSPDHVGIVEAVSGGVITVIEGNKSNSVARRQISVNGRYIRGFGVPDYASKATKAEPAPAPAPERKEEKTVTITLAQIKKGSKGPEVKTLQRLLKQLGYKDQYGKQLAIDGDFGSKTDYATRGFQKATGLGIDGICGVKTWTKLLKGV